MTQTPQPDAANQQNPVAGNPDETSDPSTQQPALHQNLDVTAEVASEPEGTVGSGMNPP